MISRVVDSPDERDQDVPTTETAGGEFVLILRKVISTVLILTHTHTCV